jgi:hypothetical protein
MRKRSQKDTAISLKKLLLAKIFTKPDMKINVTH